MTCALVHSLNTFVIAAFLTMLEPALPHIIMDNAFVNVCEHALILGDTFRCHASNVCVLMCVFVVTD